MALTDGDDPADGQSPSCAVAISAEAQANPPSRRKRKGMEQGLVHLDGEEPSSAAGVEVITQKGKRVKVMGPMEDPWSHGEPSGIGFKCGYCPMKNGGGGVTRLREHLGGIRGFVRPCPSVPLVVKALMVGEVKARKKRKRENDEHRLFVEREIMLVNQGRVTQTPLSEDAQLEMAVRNSLRDIHRGSFGAANFSANQQTKLDKFYPNGSTSNVPFDIDLARSMVQRQPRIDTMLHGTAREKLGKALAKWFHANDIPGRKADCPYFRSAMMLAQQLGEGVHIPNGREIDGPLLDMNYAEMEEHLSQFKGDWRQYGVTIMCDSWTGPTMMCIINFMVFCNGRMFFHKSVNATGYVQDAEFIYDHIKEVVVKEIGAEFVVQIVTDNGSNYKKACKHIISEYPRITWQPCAAHTINLMLKDIGQFLEVMDVVDSAKRICRFLYKHNRLHAMMREAIGGELIRWNATRFGTVFICLQSFWDRKDKFRAWMTSKEWNDSPWSTDNDHEYTEDCLSSRIWWNQLELVLKAVTPIYRVLRFADQQKNGTISGFIPRMLNAVEEMKKKLSDKEHLLNKLTVVVNKRLRYLLHETLMLAAAGLDPEALYRSKLSSKQSCRLAVTLALKKIADSSSQAAIAIEQYALFSAKKGLCGGEEARKSALSGRMTAADWWNSYGGQCKELQKLAIRIVSQCMSSSGCERNWSTFALIHTKLRNKLRYEKLDKLVSVHYNLKLRIQHYEADLKTFQEMQSLEERESDPCSIMMDVALYDEDNPIMDWLGNSMSESIPTLDENDGNDSDSPNPSRLVIDELELEPGEWSEFQKNFYGTKGGKKKAKVVLDEEEEGIADDYESESSQDSPVYDESGDSSDDSDGDDGHADGNERPCHGGASGSGAPRRSSGCGDRGGRASGSVQPAASRARSTRTKKLSLKGIYNLRK